MSRNSSYVVPFVDYYLRKFVKRDHLVLDIGSGMGQYRACIPASYIGLDITSKPYSENHPRIVDIVASATNIPSPSNSYDLIFSVAALYQIMNPSDALAESYRVLKPRGRILLFDYTRRTQRRLETLERSRRPCWTQWELKELAQKNGFRQCEVLLPNARQFGKLQRILRLILNELFGQWAVVTGVK